MSTLPVIKHLALAAIGTGFLAFGISASAEAALIGSNTTTGNFDRSSGTRTITFTGAEAGFGNGLIQDLDVIINFAKADGESFAPPFPTGTPFFNEVVFRLTSPLGTVVNLINSGSFNVGSGPGFDGTIRFDDAAAQVVNVNRNLIQAGTFKPLGLLSDFNGQSALGSWTLFIEDTVGADSLRFRSAQLVAEAGGTQAIPTPALLPGLIGLGFGVLRKRKAEAAKQTSEV